MARIAGVDLPRDKRIEYALPYIYGIGLTLSREILAKTGINLIPAFAISPKKKLLKSVKLLTLIIK